MDSHGTTVAARVPYVAAYNKETVALDLVVIHDMWALSGRRLSYTDPRADDWNLSVLWARQKCDRRGKVNYQEMHTLRQRTCMLHRLCQVCEGPALDPGTGRPSWVFHEKTPPRPAASASHRPACGASPRRWTRARVSSTRPTSTPRPTTNRGV
ncbi:hypothetical protein AB0L53_52220 [Nonomuraea sp. NPDC052129]|uniref:hypothetical protein n=1 Tax=Nonomuraea sp. NPDC052129 TaxID=3154651 RepID=UPI00342AE25A